MTQNHTNNLILNRIQTPDGTILTSYHCHDYKTYTDKSGKIYAIDGGLEYLKRSGHQDYDELSLYDDEPFDVIRENLHWGNAMDKEGNLYEETKWTPIFKLDTGHIESILKGGWGSDWIREFLELELIHRKREQLLCEMKSGAKKSKWLYKAKNRHEK